MWSEYPQTTDNIALILIQILQVLNTIKSDVETGNTTLSGIKIDVESGNTTLSNIKSNSDTANTTLSGIKTDVETGNTTLSNIKTDVESGNTTLSNIKSNGDTANTDLTNIITLLTNIQQPTHTYTIVKGTDLTGKATKGIWVGLAGTVIAKLSNDSATNTFTCLAGEYVPGNFILISSSSTANGLIGLY